MIIISRPGCSRMPRGWGGMRRITRTLEQKYSRNEHWPIKLLVDGKKYLRENKKVSEYRMVSSGHPDADSDYSEF
jgi:hypothetical protein